MVVLVSDSYLDPADEWIPVKGTRISVRRESDLASVPIGFVPLDPQNARPLPAPAKGPLQLSFIHGSLLCLWPPSRRGLVLFRPESAPPYAYGNSRYRRFKQCPYHYYRAGGLEPIDSPILLKRKKQMSSGHSRVRGKVRGRTIATSVIQILAL